MTQTYRTAHTRLGSRTPWIAACLVGPLFTSNVALADVICGDKTCPQGFTCESRELGACPAIATIDGGAVPCPNSTVYECVPGPCSVDTDCADGMVCHSSTSTACSTTSARPTCAPDAVDCIVVADPVPPSCTTTTQQQCVPRYLLPCTTASDCGSGFTCEEQQYTTCSGSAGTATPGTTTSAPVASTDSGSAPSGGSTGVVAADVPVSTVAECSTMSSGTFACKLQTIACSADAECPVGFTCVDNPSGSCWASSAGTTGCTTPDPVKLCQPPYASITQGVAQDDTASGEIYTTAAPTIGADDTSAKAVDPAPADPGSVSGSGCAVTASPAGNRSRVLTLLLAVGLALGIRRRHL